MTQCDTDDIVHDKTETTNVWSDPHTTILNQNQNQNRQDSNQVSAIARDISQNPTIEFLSCRKSKSDIV